jgi:pSer/pThr/pTyr-binding forkhead associated (FHA) protein
MTTRLEIQGIADRDKRSEELVCEIANLITARSNTFSVYAIGQALEQTPDGRLTVSAEQRQHALIERYSIGDSREVRLRTVYFRNLIP